MLFWSVVVARSLVACRVVCCVIAASTASVLTTDVVCLVDVSVEVISLVSACDVVLANIGVSEAVD